MKQQAESNLAKQHNWAEKKNRRQTNTYRLFQKMQN